MKTLVHSFGIGDVEDPEIYSAAPILDFEKSEKGQWLKERAVEQMSYTIGVDPYSYGYRCSIWAVLKEEDLVFYRLKWEEFK